MEETLKNFIDNQGKLHRLEMINSLLYQTYHYVNDIYEKIQDEFYDLENFDDHIIESVVNTIKNNLDILQKFL